ncbi:hypothetical protein [Vibrio rumoiensis]|uniref:Uncharacterized protein n=1 Tax=Vibrio rumoiensis 1S-45 TaxID=1188252 RepID=A0A1E5E429_9VIBR|nr:hypothetical protein [Vibrio rumoiensis]OEF27434.1 hypothetical protein A1QC_14925 [Vibrio rumoiensis 1S-45]
MNQNCPACKSSLAPHSHRCVKCGYFLNPEDDEKDRAKRLAQQKAMFDQMEEEDYTSFRWWNVWAGLNVVASTLTFFIALSYDLTWLAAMMGIVFVFAVYCLRLNKYAFVILTVMTFDPILMLINHRYLKSRWNHKRLTTNL